MFRPPRAIAGVRVRTRSNTSTPHGAGSSAADFVRWITPAFAAPKCDTEGPTVVPLVEPKFTLRPCTPSRIIAIASACMHNMVDVRLRSTGPLHWSTA